MRTAKQRQKLLAMLLCLALCLSLVPVTALAEEGGEPAAEPAAQTAEDLSPQQTEAPAVEPEETPLTEEAADLSPSEETEAGPEAEAPQPEGDPADAPADGQESPAPGGGEVQQPSEEPGADGEGTPTTEEGTDPAAPEGTLGETPETAPEQPGGTEAGEGESGEPDPAEETDETETDPADAGDGESEEPEDIEGAEEDITTQATSLQFSTFQDLVDYCNNPPAESTTIVWDGYETFEIDDNLTIPEGLEVVFERNSVLVINKDLTVRGALTMKGSSLQNDGNLYVYQAISLLLGSGSRTSTLDNSGTMTLLEGGKLIVEVPAGVDDPSTLLEGVDTSVLSLNQDGNIYTYTDPSNAGQNASEFSTLDELIDICNMAYSAGDEAVYVGSGPFSISRGSHANTLQVPDNLNVIFNGVDVTIESGAFLMNQGTFTLRSGNLKNNGVITNAGRISLELSETGQAASFANSGQYGSNRHGGEDANGYPLISFPGEIYVPGEAPENYVTGIDFTKYQEIPSGDGCILKQKSIYAFVSPADFMSLCSRTYAEPMTYQALITGGTGIFTVNEMQDYDPDTGSFSFSYLDEVTIPENLTIEFPDGGLMSLRVIVPPGCTLTINGELAGKGFSLQNNGTVVLGETGVISLSRYDNSNYPKVDGVIGSIDSNVNNGRFLAKAGGSIFVQKTDKPETQINGVDLSGFEKTQVSDGYRYTYRGIGGNWGDNITWTLDSEGTLTLSGTGEMAEPDRPWNDGGSATGAGTESVYPWYPYSGQIRKIVIEDGITFVSPYAFRRSAVSEVAFPEGLYAIGDMAFNNCHNLEEISFPSTLQHIRDYAFISTGISTFSIPQSVNYIGDGALSSYRLESIVLEGSNENFYLDEYGILYQRNRTSAYDKDLPGDSLLFCPRTVSGDIVIHNGHVSDELITYIASYAFSGCRDINSVTFPESLKKIGYWTFGGSGIQYVRFLGSAPDMYPVHTGGSFSGTAGIDAYYHTDSTWTDIVLKQNYGSNVNWIPLANRGADGYSYNVVPMLTFPQTDIEGNPRNDVWLQELQTPPYDGTVTYPEAEEIITFADGSTVFTESEFVIELDKSAVAEQQYSFTLYPASFDRLGQAETLNAKAVKYVSSDPKIAAVGKVQADGCVTVTIMKGAEGACSITAVSTATAAEQSIVLHIRNFIPRLETNKITLNSYSEQGTDILVLPAYNNTINSILLAKAGKNGKALRDSDENIVWDDSGLQISRKEADLWTVTADRTLKGTIKTVLVASTGNGEEAELPLTVSIKNSDPKITFTQIQKFNTFLKAGEAVFRISDPSLVLNDGSVDPPITIVSDSFEGSWDEGSGELHLTRKEDAPAKLNSNVKISFMLAGYRDRSYTGTLKVATTSEKANVVLTQSNFSINCKQQNKSVSFYLRDMESDDPDTPFVVDDGAARRWKIESISPASAARLECINDIFRLTSLTDKSATVIFSVSDESWTAPLTFTVKLTVNKKLSTAQLSKTTLLLNAAYPAVTDSASLTTGNQNEVLSDRYRQLRSNTPHSEKLWVTYENGQVSARIRDTTVKPGSYKFVFTPTLDDGTVLKAVTVTVKVVNTLNLTATVKSSGKLDAIQRDTGAITYTVQKIANLSDEVVDIQLWNEDGLDNELFRLEMVENEAGDSAQAKLTLKPEASVSTKNTYKIRLAVYLKSANVPIITPVQKVKVAQSALKVAITPKTAVLFQGQSVERAATFRLSLSSPTEAKIADVRLSSKTPLAFWKSLGTNGNIEWLPDELTDDYGNVITDENGNSIASGLGGEIHVTAKDPGKLVAGKSYSVLLEVYPVGAVSNSKPTTVSVTVKVQK